MSGRPAVFVDRDGVVNALAPDPDTGLPESPLHPDQVVLLPGAADALAELAATGFVLICVSNQPAAAKGKVELDELLAVNDAVLARLAGHGVAFDDVRLCLHHPAGVVLELSGPCRCRKPEPGMLLDAARAQGLDLSASWIIGDSDSDVEAGRAAGCKTVLVEHPHSAHRRGSAQPDERASDILSAARAVLDRTHH